MVPLLFALSGYSGGHAAVVGSVLVTNLKTGVRNGGWDQGTGSLFPHCSFSLAFLSKSE